MNALLMYWASVIVQWSVISKWVVNQRFKLANNDNSRIIYGDI